MKLWQLLNISSSELREMRKYMKKFSLFQVYSVVQMIEKVLQVKFRFNRSLEGYIHQKHTPVFTQHAFQVLLSP